MFTRNKRSILAFLWLACFVFGVFFWKIYNSGALFVRTETSDRDADELDLTVNVGDYLITRNEIEWEYSFYFDGLNNGDDEGKDGAHTKLSSKELNEKIEGQKPIVELYNKILGDLIERKLLFQYVKKDKLFDIDSPRRYISCLESWQKSVQQKPHFFSSQKSSDRLKSLLCEKEILQQYVSERIEANIKVSNDELKTYYEKNKAEYNDGAKVTIRQILLASENDAKKVQAKLNSGNFVSLVREFSIAPEASSGGLLGPFSKGEMPSLFDVAFDMRVGEIQGIIKSPYGFHIIMLEKKFPRAASTFETARSRVQTDVLKKKKEEEYTKWVETALNTIPIRSSKNL